MRQYPKALRTDTSGADGGKPEVPWITGGELECKKPIPLAISLVICGHLTVKIDLDRCAE